MTPPAPCWYCGRPSVLLCDYVLGAGLRPDTCEWDPARGAPSDGTAGCSNRATVIVGADGYLRACDSCAAAPELRRRRSRKPITSPAIRIETCDAATCQPCAARFGWRRLGGVIVCGRPGGCRHDSVDRCHAHAGEGPTDRGELDGPAAQAARAALKSACAELFRVAPPPPIIRRDIKPDNRDRWRENQALFLAELREGRRWQEWAAAELKLRGLRVELPEHSERALIEDADRWTMQDQDIVVRNTAVGDCTLEVKSRPLHFIDPPGYPYPTALVDTVDGWAAKAVEPRAVLLVSRPAKRILVVSAATRPRWSVKRARDRVRNTVADFYECPRALLATMEWLVSKLLP